MTEPFEVRYVGGPKGGQSAKFDQVEKVPDIESGQGGNYRKSSEVVKVAQDGVGELFPPHYTWEADQ